MVRLPGKGNERNRHLENMRLELKNANVAKGRLFAIFLHIQLPLGMLCIVFQLYIKIDIGV